MSNPYPFPLTLSPTLTRVMAYWDGLKRGGNKIPFWDDVNLSALPDLTDRLMLINVYTEPERFRFNSVGKEFLKQNTGSLNNIFADGIELRGSLKFVRSQCSATVEAREPTFYRDGGSPDDAAFARILMPMWGDGRIGMLLGALDPH